MNLYLKEDTIESVTIQIAAYIKHGEIDIWFGNQKQGYCHLWTIVLTRMFSIVIIKDTQFFIISPVY